MARDVLTLALFSAGVMLGTLAALDWIGYSRFVFAAWAW